jgi:AcrR family transcriptional regulator
MTSEDFVPDTLRRLWRIAEPTRLGRPATLDIDGVVAAAVDLADRDGLGGVTLPKVAASLGVTGMSLYRHVGSKDELLVLMTDHALGPPPEPETDDWRAGLRAWAFAQRTVLRRRPWLTRIPASGPPSGPNQIAWLDAGLTALAGTSLDWAHKVGVLSLVGGYVMQSVRLESDFAESRSETQAQSDVERDYGRALAALVTTDRFPQAARLFSSALFEVPPDDAPPDADFLFGLDLILDGVTARNV